MNIYAALRSQVGYRLVIACILLTVVTVDMWGKGALSPEQVQAQINSWAQPAPIEYISDGWENDNNPDIAVDSNGISHAVFWQTNYNSGNPLNFASYSNNRSGSWSKPVRLSVNLSQHVMFPAIDTRTIGGQVILDVVYNTSSGIFYRRSADGGVSWLPDELIAAGDGFDPHIFLDDTGQPHVIYSLGDGDDISLYYGTKVGGVWAVSGNLSPDRNRSVEGKIHVTRDPANNKVLHVFYKTHNWGASPGDRSVVYLRKVGIANWERREFARDDMGKPHIASNTGTVVHLAMNGKVGVFAGSYDYESFFYRSLDSGASWSSAFPIGAQTADITNEAALGRLSNGYLMALISDRANSSGASDIYTRLSTDDGSSWGPSLRIFQSAGGSREATQPEIDAGPTGFQGVWQNNNTGPFRIWTSFYQTGESPPTSTPTPEPLPTNTPTPTPEPKPQISIDLDGIVQGNDNEEVTAEQAVRVEFTIISGQPDQYRLSNDQINWSNYQPLPTDDTIDEWVISSPDGDACQPRTVYAQVRDSAQGLESDVAQGSIIYDPNVNADVIVRNPFLKENPMAMLQDFAQAGASDGDPGYTRNDFYYAEVNAPAGECSGIESVSFGQPGLAATESSGALVQDIMPFANFIAQDGSQVVFVDVVDGVGHTRRYERTIIRDTANPQVLNSDGSFSVSSTDGLSPTESIFVTLTFEGLEVEDNLYTNPNNSDAQLWGVWLAASRQQLTISDTAQLDLLNWQPAEVVSVSSADGKVSFEISRWNLLNGVASEDRTGGDYYLYARVLDGAGNASDTMLTANDITLSDDFIVPAVYLPLIIR